MTQLHFADYLLGQYTATYILAKSGIVPNSEARAALDRFAAWVDTTPTTEWLIKTGQLERQD